MKDFFSDSPNVKESLSGILAGEFRFADEAERFLMAGYADKALAEPFPVLTATMYLRFSRDGNRSEYDGASGKRRSMVMALLLGVMAGDKEKYKDKLIDTVWAMLEDTSWVIPAHNVSRPYVVNGKPLPDAYEGDPPEVDLFAAETGSLLSFVYLYAKEMLDDVTDVICERIGYEVRRRIIRPFLDHEMRWISRFVNNWAPWIVSNVLTCAAVFSKGDELRAVIGRARNYLNRFVATYGNDGGCDEGSSYWSVAVGALFDAAEILSDLTGDETAFDAPGFRKMAEFPADMCVNPASGIFVNYGDCMPYVTYDRRLIARMAKRLSSEKLARLSESMRSTRMPSPSGLFYRCIKSLTEPLPEKKDAALPDSTVLYPDLQIVTMRRGRFFMAIKGGHNGEHHNHNDVGNVILYDRDDPVLIDAGVGAYKRQTFSDKRYSLWTMQSSFHNLPEIAGTMEKDGPQYRADRFTCDGNSVSVSFSGAYPPDAGVRLATRKATLTADGLVLEDKTDPEDAVFNFITKYWPEKIGFLRFRVGACCLQFDGGECSVEEIDLENDRELTRTWQQERLYRIRVRSRGAITTVIHIE